MRRELKRPLFPSTAEPRQMGRPGEAITMNKLIDDHSGAAHAPVRDAPSWLGALRLAIGFVQGLALLWLHRASDGVAEWPATQPSLFGPLLLVVALLPIMLLAGVGACEPALW